VAKKTLKEARPTGTLIRGADGGLYFVEDNKRWARRLPDQFTEEARALLDRDGFIANPGELPAFHGSGLVRIVYPLHDPEEIRVDLNRLATLGRRKSHEK